MPSKKFRMISKPEKPERKMVVHTMDAVSSSTLQDVMDWAIEFGVTKPMDVTCGTADYDYGSSFSVSVPEPVVEYKARLRDYEKKLAEYNAWRRENSEAVESFEKNQVEKKRKETERWRSELLKEKAAIEKRLAKLEG